jgi:hypothetical protein
MPTATGSRSRSPAKARRAAPSRAVQTITYTPAQAGADSFTYTASDGGATSQPATVTVTSAQGAESLTITILLGLVSFKKKPDDDRARFEGTHASSQALRCAMDVTFALNTSAFAEMLTGSAFGSTGNGRRSVYQQTGAGGRGGIRQLELNARVFAVHLEGDADLAALTDPSRRRRRLRRAESSRAAAER